MRSVFVWVLLSISPLLYANTSPIDKHLLLLSAAGINTQSAITEPEKIALLNHYWYHSSPQLFPLRKENSPPNSFPTHPKFEQIIAKLTALNAIDASHWQQFSHKEIGTLKVGAKHRFLPAIKTRLHQLGYLAAKDNDSRQFDQLTLQAIKRFQQDHHLRVNGKIGLHTLVRLNWLPAYRARVLASSALEQTRYFHSYFSRDHLLINIPQYQLSFIRRGSEQFTSKVIVGEIETPTPEMSTYLRNLVSNPSWKVPERIFQQELLQKIASDPKRYQAQGFAILDDKGQEINPVEVNWSSLLSSTKGFRLIQRSGAANAMGKVKFFLEDNQQIYLHDTPNKWLFNRHARAFSNGCIRVEKAMHLADQLVDNYQYSDKLWHQAKLAEKEQWLNLSVRLPVHIVYWGALLNVDGTVQYFPDLYGKFS